MYYKKKVPIGTQVHLNTLKGMARECFSGGTTVIAEGVQAIRDDLINLLTISKGEAFFDPNVGSNLESYVFELNDFALRDMIRRDITIGITENLPEVEVEDVNITQYADKVEIYVKYKIISLGIYDTVTIYKNTQEKFNF